MFRLGLWFLLLVSLPLTANEISLNAEDCLKSVMTQQLESISLADNCPKLFADLNANNILQATEPPLTSEINSKQLIALAALLQQNNIDWQLSYQNLHSLLEEIRIPEPKDAAKSWWQQFKDWLQSFKSKQTDADYQWLFDVLNNWLPSEAFLKSLTKVLIYALVLASLGIIIWECYVAGMFQRLGFRGKTKATRQPASTIINQSGLAFSEIQQLPAIDQIAALLKYVIAQLISQQQLPEDTSLSNQQLMTCLEQQSAPSTLAFTQLVQQSEPVIYGNTPVSPDILQRCWQHAKVICTN